MRKAQIHFSNRLENLLNPLKEGLFPEGASPFDKRLVAVPHLSMKGFLMQALAQDSQLHVAAGLQITTLQEALAKVAKKKAPSPLELSLKLQHALIPMIEKDPSLRNYFDSEAKERRIGPFCDVLANVFLRYAHYGKPRLSPWQEALWKDLDFTIEPRSNWQIHLFGFSVLPRSTFSFFEKLGAKFYLFSPCQIFWGDYYSEKEKAKMAKTEGQLDFFEDQNPFLANWGKVGRKMHLFIEEGNIPSIEHYEANASSTSLHTFQNNALYGVDVGHGSDESLAAFSASSPLHEVETLQKRLLPLFEKGIEPRDIQVFAPDINRYAPFIQAVFSDIPHSLADLKTDEFDPLAKAFGKLVSLPKGRFKKEEVLQLFSLAPFREKFDLDLPLIKKWLKLANVRFGVSEEQKRLFFLQEMESIETTSSEGTFASGLHRLILGLGQSQEPALSCVSITEMEELNKLYCLLFSLEEDLAPFSDETRWTIPTWLRFFACLMESYFAFEPGEDLHKTLLQLASNLDHLDKEEVPFAGVERILTSLLGGKGKTLQAPHLQAIRFASLTEGCALPSKVICLLGMQEESFPRREDENSLFAGDLDYRPKKGDLDRYLFLQLALSARAYFWMSYVHGPTSNFGASLLINPLCAIEHVQKRVRKPCKEQEPLFSSNREPIKAEALEIDIQKLFNFARHPLRFYLSEILGISPEFEEREGEGEFILSYLTKSRLVRESFKKPVEEVLKIAKARGDLPVGLLLPLAKEQIEKELELYETYPQELQIEPIEVGGVRLFGTIDNYTAEGLLVKGKDCLEDRIMFWPQGLIAKELGLPLINIKDKTVVHSIGSLETYIAYFKAALQTPSPLIPQLAKPLLEGGAMDLKKALKKIDDNIFHYLAVRGEPLNAEEIHEKWSGYLQSIFGGVDAAV